MKFSIVCASLLALTHVAAAEPEAPAEVLNSSLAARQGLHFGVTAGAVYVPVLGAAGALAELDLNYGRGNHDFRLSTVIYHASQDDQSSTGAGIALRHAWNFGSMYTASIGALVGVHHIDKDSGNTYTTLGLAIVGSPVTLRFGDKGNVAVGLDLMLMREFQFDSVNPGAFVSLSYLVL